MKQKLVLIGGGGHCRSCIDVIESEDRFSIEKIVDLPDKLGMILLKEHRINAVDDDIPGLVDAGYWFLITLGQIKSPELRVETFERLLSLNAQIATVISPLAHVSHHGHVGPGTIVLHHALINAGVTVGSNCIINSKALLEHDVKVGNHCHISTASVLNGGVSVGDGTFLGSQSVTREYITIGKNVIISAGARVMRNVENGENLK
jgi:sugar O-acyltransferase (sialic acid O-acetyltransferase NeuD family)